MGPRIFPGRQAAGNGLIDAVGGEPEARAWLAETKVWPSVNRIDNAYGDRNLVCSCPPVADWAEPAPGAS